MVIVAYAIEEKPPTNRHNELVNVRQVSNGSYYCTWIIGPKKGDGYFLEHELELFS